MDMRILILRTGHTDAEIMRRHGDYDEWFRTRLEGLGCRLTVHDVPGSGIPDAASHDGVLVTGTADSVMQPAPWMEDLACFVRQAVATVEGPPVLGVCFAAQLAAQALGGQVERNPRGWEIGTVRIRLTGAGQADPLFAGLPADLEVQATHEDHVTRLPDSATLLAGNDMSPVQAFAAGGRLRMVQFHPEASAGIIRDLISLRRDQLESEALAQGSQDPAAAPAAVERLVQETHDTAAGRRILANWINGCVRRFRPR